jgi:hypothetical protein
MLTQPIFQNNAVEQPKFSLTEDADPAQGPEKQLVVLRG